MSDNVNMSVSTFADLFSNEQKQSQLNSLKELLSSQRKTIKEE